MTIIAHARMVIVIMEELASILMSVPKRSIYVSRILPVVTFLVGSNVHATMVTLVMGRLYVSEIRARLAITIVISMPYA